MKEHWFLRATTAIIAVLFMGLIITVPEVKAQYSGLYGSSLYGGMYGSSLYGGLMGGMYGSSMYGGLYGSSMYGGLGGLYGSSLYGGLGRYGLAEQAGTWSGIWTSGLVSGPMTLNLVTDPILGTLSGYVQLLGNAYLGTLVSVTGTVLNNQIIISGSGLGLGSTNYTIDVVGTLTSTTTMTGTYTLINSSSIKQTGSFNLTLLTPVV